MSATLHKLQYLRKKKGLNQEQMADILGMTVYGYRKIEQGSRKISIELALKIKLVVEVAHIEDFLDAG